MKKGVQITLLTVAIALFGLHAVTFAAAPTISGVPNPIIVGDLEDTTTPNTFVFPDAIDLRDYVTDDVTAPDDILWSYWMSAESGYSQGRYKINNVNQLSDAQVVDPLVTADPPIANQIDLGSGDVDADSEGMTITIRDQYLTPLGTPWTPQTPSPGITGSASVWLFAGDGSTSDSVNILVQSDDGGNDRYAQAGTTRAWRASEVLKQVDFNLTGANGFTSSTSGTASCSTSGNGINITVGAAGLNSGYWQSADSYIDVVADSVWCLRMKVTSDQTDPLHVPWWNVVLKNEVDLGIYGRGPYGYGGEAFYLANIGSGSDPVANQGVNAAMADDQVALGVGRNMFEFWYTPACIGTTRFTGNYQTGAPDNEDAEQYLVMMFRVLDNRLDMLAGVDEGRVSLEDLDLYRYPLTPSGSTTNVMNATLNTAASSTWQAFDSYVASGGNASIYTWGTYLNVSPNTDWTGNVVDIYPGTDRDWSDLAGGTNVADNFPITWEDNTLYRLQVGMSNPGATNDMVEPPDQIMLLMDSPTNEIIATSLVTPGLNIWNADPTLINYYAMPNSGAAQTYQMFYYSHSVPRSGDIHANVKAIRPRIQLASGVARTYNPTYIYNRGKLNVHTVVVDKVTYAN